MTRVKVTVRPSSDLRCAFCHGELTEEPRPCRACFTALHDECWEDAGICPTLGCATWSSFGARIRIFPRVVVASWWLFGLALTSAATVLGILTLIVPAFTKMFTDTGLSLPGPTEGLVNLSRFACSWPGALVIGASLPLSVVGFRRWRRTRWLAPLLHASFWLTAAFIGLTVVALFSPLIQLTQKL